MRRYKKVVKKSIKIVGTEQKKKLLGSPFIECTENTKHFSSTIYEK